MSTLKTDLIQTTSGKPLLNSSGSIIQVKTAVLGSNTATSSTSYVAVAGLIVDMTPSSSTNRFIAISTCRQDGSYPSSIQHQHAIYVGGSVYANAVSSQNDGYGRSSHAVQATGIFNTSGSLRFQVYIAQAGGTSTTLIAADCMLTVYEVVV